MADRGCPHHCAYCNVPSVKALYAADPAPFFRHRSPQHVIAELETACRRFPSVEAVQFFDDTFFAKPFSWFEAFADLYAKRVGLPFYCQASPATLDARKLDLLLDVGLCFVEMGVQTGSEKLRRLFGRTESNQRIEECGAMRVRESFLRDLLRLFAWYPFRWLAERLPPRLAVRVFRALGDAHWAVAPGKRRLLARNLGRLGIAADQASRAVRENFRIHYVSQLLVFFYSRLTRTSLGKLAAVAGLEHLDAALAQGRGVVLVQAHFGPEQLALAALSLLGHRVVQIGCANDAGLSAVGRGVSLRLRRRYEARIPGRIIDARESLLPALRVLRANGLVLTAGDGAGWAKRLGRHVPGRSPAGNALYRCRLHGEGAAAPARQTRTDRALADLAAPWGSHPRTPGTRSCLPGGHGGTFIDFPRCFPYKELALQHFPSLQPATP